MCRWPGLSFNGSRFPFSLSRNDFGLGSFLTLFESEEAIVKYLTAITAAMYRNQPAGAELSEDIWSIRNSSYCALLLWRSCEILSNSAGVCVGKPSLPFVSLSSFPSTGSLCCLPCPPCLLPPLSHCSSILKKDRAAHRQSSRTGDRWQVTGDRTQWTVIWHEVS